MDKIYFSPLSLVKSESVLRKYTAEFDINFQEHKTKEIFISLLSLTFEDLDLKNNILDSINAHFDNQEGKEIFITSHCIDDVCEAHQITPSIIDNLISVALRYSIYKNTYEIIDSEKDSAQTKQIKINFTQSSDNITEEIYKIENCFEEENLNIVFNVNKLAYKDASKLHHLWKTNSKNLTLLNQELFLLLTKTIKNSEKQILSEADLLKIFKGNLAAMYDFIQFCVEFNYKNKSEKKVIFTPVM